MPSVELTARLALQSKAGKKDTILFDKRLPGFGFANAAYLPPIRCRTASLRHGVQARTEAHIFVAYCLHVTLKNLARPRAPGLTPRAILEKFSTPQMVDAHLPTTDGRHLVLPRHTQPERDHQLLLDQLKLRLPEQPLPRIST